MIRKLLIIAVWSSFLVACGEKEGTKLGSANNGDDNNGIDECAVVSDCDAEGLSCDGNTHVVCEENENGCLVRTSEIDCESPQVCDATLGCVDAGSCTDDAGCEGAADGDTSCDGTQLTTCSTGADGCMDAVAEDCADDGMVCDDSGADAMCVATSGVCGDGTIDTGEQCDDGNVNPGDGCDANCQVEPICGDGNVDAGEGCDDGNTTPGDGCDANCQLEAMCGDGNVDANEQCDDGNNVPGDGCSANCQIEPACGDGNIDANEQCDDGNTTPGDGCDANCQLEPACGDGNIDANEQCDDGNTTPGDGCDANCQLEPVCGDGNIDANEQCDDGNTTPGDGCDANCQIEAVCGDGTVDANEECDDGDNDDGDGCDANCGIELGYDCDNTGCTMWPLYDPSASSTFTSTMPPPGGVEFTSAGGRYDCDFDTATMGDVDIEVLDDTGTVVNTYANDGAEAFFDQPIPAGNYFIRVNSRMAAMPIDGFTIDCLREPIDLGTLAVGTNIDMPGDTAFGLDPIRPGDTDLYRITIPAGESQMLNVDVSNGMDDFDIEFLDDQMNQLMDVPAENSSRANILLRPGTYFMRIRMHLAISLALATYALRITTQSFTPYNIGSFAAGDTFPSLSGGAVAAGEAFFLRFVLTTAATVSLVLNGWSQGNMHLLLWGINGLIASSTTTGFETIAALQLVAGVYMAVLIGITPVNAHGLSGTIAP